MALTERSLHGTQISFATVQSGKTESDMKQLLILECRLSLSGVLKMASEQADTLMLLLKLQIFLATIRSADMTKQSNLHNGDFLAFSFSFFLHS